MVERTSVVIYYSDDSVLKSLSKDINVYYQSKENYAILYFDRKREKEIMSKLKSNQLITSIEKSNIPYKKYNF